MAPLPVVGLQVVLQGVAAFGSGAKTVDGFAQNLGRSMFVLQRSTVGAFDGIDRAFQSVEKTTAKLSASQAKLLATQTATYATLAQRAADGARAEIAASNQARDVIVSNSKSRVAQVAADANRVADAEIAASKKALDTQIRHATTLANNKRIALRQETATGVANIRANAQPGPAGRATRDIDIAQLKADAATQDAIIVAQRDKSFSVARTKSQQQIALANQTRVAVTTAAQQTAAVEIASAQASAREVNQASLQKSAAAIRSAEAQAAAATQVAEAQAAQSAAQAASVQAAATTIVGAIAAITAAYAALIVVTTKTASDYEQQFARIAGVTGATASDIERLKGAVQSLRGTPTSISDLTEAIYDLSTAGASTADIVGGQLKAVNDLVIASGNKLSADTAAVSIATTTNAFKNYQKEGASAADVTDVITAAAQKSAQTFESVGTAVQRSAGTLARSGVSLQDFGALVTLVGQQIKDGSTAGSALQRMFLDLQAPTDKQNEIMEKYKVSLYDVNNNLRPTRDFILGLNKAFGEGAIAAGRIDRATRDAALANLFEQNSIRAVNAILDGGIEKFDEYADSAEGAAKVAVDAQLGTAENKYKVLTNAVTAASIAFGTNFLPILKDTIDGVTAFVNSIPAAEIGNFSAKILEMGAAFATFVTQLGITKEGLLLTAGAIAAAFLPQIAAVVAALLAALAPIIALGAAFGLVALIFSQESDNIAKIVGTLADQIGGAMKAIFDGFAAFFGPFVAQWQKNWSTIVDIVVEQYKQQLEVHVKGLNTIFKLFGDFANTLGLNWKDFWKGMVLAALGPIGSILNILKSLADIGVPEGDPLEPFFKSIKETSDKIDDVFSTLAGEGGQLTEFGKNFKAAFDFAGPAAEKFVADATEAFEGFAKRTGDSFGHIGNDTEQLIKKLQILWAEATTPHKVELEAELVPPKKGGGGGDETTQPGFRPPDPKKFKEAFDKLVALARDTQQAINKLAEDAQQKFAAIASKAADAVADAQREISKSVSEAIRDAAKSIADLNRDAAQGLADRARTDALQRQQDAANVARDKGLADADHAHQRELELDDEFYQKQQDAQNRAFDQLQKDADIAHAREIDNLNIVHERELDDARRAFDEQQRLALSAFTDQQEADQRQFQQRADLANLEYQHEIDIDKAIADARKKLNDELEKETKDRAQKLEEENERHLNTLQQAQNQAIIDAENRRHAKETGRINDVGNDTQSKAQEELQATIDNLNAQYDAQVKDYERRLALDEQARKFREDQEAALAAFRKAQEADVLKYQQDAEAAALVRRRQQEDDDRARSAAQDDAARVRKEQQEADELTRRHAIEDAEIARKRAQDEADRAYSRQQDEAQRALQDQLAREALARRIAEINAERDAKLKALDEELRARLAKIERERQQEVATFLADLQQRIKIIRQEFIDKLPAILEAGGAAIAPIVNGFLDLISAQLGALETQAIGTANAVTGAAVASVGAIAGAISAANSAILGTQTAAQSAASASQRAAQGSPGTNTGRAYQDAPQGQTFDLVPQYAEGGIVAGPTGAPQFAIVHGGELIIPAAALRAMVTPAVGGSSTRNVSYNVEANYRNTQSEGSVRQDMQALVALSRH